MASSNSPETSSGGGDSQDAGKPAGTAPLKPGDEAPPGSPGTGENLCRECGGSGRDARGNPCPQCQGTGKVNVGIGGA